MIINPLYAFKRFLVVETGLSDPVLHVLIGLTIFLTAHAITRSPWKAFLLLAFVQAANEINDYTVKGSSGLVLFLTDTAFDTLWTLALPLILAVVIWINPSRIKR